MSGFACYMRMRMAKWYSHLFTALLTYLVMFIASGMFAGVVAQSTTAAFDVDVVGALAEDNASISRLDVYTRISYDRLQFINSGDSFSATYDVTASLYRLDERGRRDGLAKNRSWRQEVTAGSFDLTRSPEAFDRSMESLFVPPGIYDLVVRVEDRASGRSFNEERKVLVRDFRKPVAISDLILLDAYNAEEKVITPNVANQIGTSQTSIRLFYEIYAASQQQVRIRREIVTIPPKRGLSMRSIFGLGGGDDEGEVTYTEVIPTPLKAGRTPTVVEIPTGDMEAGSYRIRLIAENESGKVLEMVEKVFTVEWTGIEDLVHDIDSAIDQLEYIAKSKELRYIRAGNTKEERLVRFRAFWDKRDPTPGTERNERMEEYYLRIAYANRNFGSLSSGWRTDRGHVAILFGEPEHVERNYTSPDSKPTEIWYYYRIGRQFIFIDRSGRGDFELLTPIWDEQTHIR